MVKWLGALTRYFCCKHPFCLPYVKWLLGQVRVPGNAQLPLLTQHLYCVTAAVLCNSSCTV